MSVAVCRSNFGPASRGVRVGEGFFPGSPARITQLDHVRLVPVAQTLLEERLKCLRLQLVRNLQTRALFFELSQPLNRVRFPVVLAENEQALQISQPHDLLLSSFLLLLFYFVLVVLHPLLDHYLDQRLYLAGVSYRFWRRFRLVQLAVS